MRCWNFLEMASKTARYLEYVDPEAFVDRRNPDPHIYAYWSHPQPDMHVSNELDWWSFDFPEQPRLPRYDVENYESEQRYHLEIWVEKSTMNDVLIPLCQQYHVNLVTGVGEQSITSTLQLINRAIESKKSVRVFYVSDFDPAGRSMPVAVARKAEYYIKKYDESIDFRLFPVALTQDQCEDYQLPRTPIKDSERRKGHFENTFGTGATELDALEALHPGTLRAVLEDYILNYYDQRLWSRTSAAREELEEHLRGITQRILEEHEEELDDLNEEYEDMKADIEDRMARYKEKTTRLWQAISEDLSAVDPDINDFPIPEGEERDEVGEGLFNSQRSYLEQLHVYKHFQGKSNGFGDLNLDLFE
jgi:hypothetical protein